MIQNSWHALVNFVHLWQVIRLNLTEFLINSFPNKPWFLCVCSTSHLKTLREKEKLLVTSNFSFSHSVLHPFRELSAIFVKLKIVVYKLFQFGRVQNLLFGKGLTLYQTFLCFNKPEKGLKTVLD